METIPSYGPFPTPDEFAQACFRLRDKKERISYCRELLAKLPLQPYADSAAHILCAHVYEELARALFQPTQHVSVDPLFQQAIRCAELSGDDPTQYKMLFSYGRYLCNDGSDRGAVWLQKALRYTRASRETIHLMTYLAMIRADDAVMYPQAIMLFDWVCVMEEAPLNTLCDKYRCLIRNGFEDEVRAIASRVLGETCEEIGTVVAARLALHRKKAAHKAALKGFTIAEETSHRHWRGQFKLVLSRSDPSIKFETGPAPPVQPDTMNNSYAEPLPYQHEFELVFYLESDPRKRVTLCREQIAKLPPAPEASPADHMLCAHVYVCLAEANYFLPPSQDAEEAYAQAWIQAELSGDDPTRYWVLTRYGSYLCRDGSMNGVPWIQKAMQYARAPHQIVFVLMRLAEIWAKEEATHALALFLYDWICLIEEAPFPAMCDRYGCMVQHGFKDEVRVIASRRLGETCEEIGAVLAARLALNRKKAAHEAAEKGYALAEATAERRWRDHFRSVLAQYDPVIRAEIRSLISGVSEQNT